VSDFNDTNFIFTKSINPSVLALL